MQEVDQADVEGLRVEFPPPNGDDVCTAIVTWPRFASERCKSGFMVRLALMRDRLGGWCELKFRNDDRTAVLRYRSAEALELYDTVRLACAAGANWPGIS